MRDDVFFIWLMILWWSSILLAQSWQSDLVQMDANGNLSYVIQADGNRIPDFSYAGYRNSEENIPFIETVYSLSAETGDNTSNIQDAIAMVGNRTPDANGFRGAVYLAAGIYDIAGTIYLNRSGVVLRGAGDGAESASNTILRAIDNSPDKRTVLIAGGGTQTVWSDSVLDTKTNIITNLVSVGSHSFEVVDPAPYQVGDNIIIYHPCTEEWLQAVEYGGTDSDPGWTVGLIPLIFNRYIKNIQGHWITVDAPVFNQLDRSLSQSYIYKYSRNGIKTNIGIENLRIDIVTEGSTTENHAWNAINLWQVEDAWVKNCTMLHFGLSGVCTNTATRVTIENCQALDPHSVIEGGKRYNFQLLYASQQVLVKDCHTTNGRHHYVSNGESSVSGCVFYNCTSSGAYTSSEGHRWWSMGLLFDNHLELDGPRYWYDPRLLGLYNRGNWGTSHGWASAHSVCWNCDVAGGDIALQKPPTAQNYAIGCFANRVTGTYFPTCFFYRNEKYEGYIEGKDTPGLEPASLFSAQLLDRLSGSEAPAAPIVDSFSDGNFTHSPYWIGNTNQWQIVTDSDVSSGSSSSYTLRLNETVAISGTKYLSTQRTAPWGLGQSWGVWMGRRSHPASEANQSIVWLWANESDLSSSTVDGYRIKFGDDFGDDEIVLQRVDNGIADDILSSLNAVPDNLTDIGFLIRVTRTESSEWTLYTSLLPSQNGQGATATDIPSAANTQAYQGTSTDATYTDFENGYFGFMAVHDNENESRTAAEFDQLYFDTRSDASLPVNLISLTAIAGDGQVELNWSTASEVDNLGFIILRGQEKYGEYLEIDSYNNNFQLRGAGNSSAEHSYLYIDCNLTNNITYWYRLLAVNFYGEKSEYGPISATSDANMTEPEFFCLEQNYPNPFNSKTMIRYGLPVISLVNISIYDISGRKIATLVYEEQSPGFFEVEWNAAACASGMYYCCMTVGGFQEIKKMLLVK